MESPKAPWIWLRNENGSGLASLGGPGLPAPLDYATGPSVLNCIAMTPEEYMSKQASNKYGPTQRIK